MVAIVATNSASPSLQATLLRARLQQARQEVTRAEAQANELRSQAEKADQEARQGKENVRAISAETSRLAVATYSPSNTKKAQEVPAKTQDFIERLYKLTSQKFSEAGNPLKSDDAPPVLNVQGQATGRILNIRA